MKSTWKLTEEELKSIYKCLKLYSDNNEKEEVIEKLIERLDHALKTTSK
jgi:predicted DNA-binding protein YlxM (UPF0122 family)